MNKGAPLIQLLKNETWDQEYGHLARARFLFRAQEALSGAGKATLASGQWYQAFDYLCSHLRDHLSGPRQPEGWEIQLAASKGKPHV